MDWAHFREIRKLGIIAVFSDDYLLDRLVLKGGNAIDIIYKISQRASMDLDFSMQDDFVEGELLKIERRLARNLQTVYGENGYMAFDIKMNHRPAVKGVQQLDLWGGYRIVYKVIKKDKIG